MTERRQSSSCRRKRCQELAPPRVHIVGKLLHPRRHVWEHNGYSLNQEPANYIPQMCACPQMLSTFSMFLLKNVWQRTKTKMYTMYANTHTTTVSHLKLEASPWSLNKRMHKMQCVFVQWKVIQGGNVQTVGTHTARLSVTNWMC